MQRKTVLLPEPLGPTTTTTSPRRTVMLKPQTAVTLPKTLKRLSITMISSPWARVAAS